MEHTAITVITSLKPDADVQALDRLLRGVGERLSAAKRLASDPDFAGIPGLHFLRLLIIKDPDRGPGRRRLLLGAVIDRDDVDGFLVRLAEVTPDLDGIWGNCEGYQGAEDFVSFMRRNEIRPKAFYIAFKDETAGDHRRYDALRRRWEKIRAERARENLDAPPVWRKRTAPVSWTLFRRLVWRRWRGLVARGVLLIRQLGWTWRDGREIVREYGWGPSWAAATTIVRGLNQYPGWRLFNLATFNIERPRRPRLSGIALDKRVEDSPDLPGHMDAGSHLPRAEDRVVQNQLTLITPIANEARLNQLGAVLGAVNSYARRWARPGNLLGMSTIHFVRWMPIDNGRRLLMLSDYDHSWEAYIDEFIEMIRTGMDAIWSSAARTSVAAYKADPSGEYPPGYLENGSGDAAAFKRFLRTHQANAQVFFTAYPSRTTLHTLEDRRRFEGVSLGMCNSEIYDRVKENSLDV